MNFGFHDGGKAHRNHFSSLPQMTSQNGFEAIGVWFYTRASEKIPKRHVYHSLKKKDGALIYNR